ncbi:uncharacterized protein LOC133199909 [Saccostrea echinata]|uniref:uncharacterized protein LOC133199909 n=1 Tax=Saccostrea echinata TaxID=191078 RepID=UPI002A811D6E|nr:uncharacterized protein LOC133199909 [Saccostrea echinata]
MKNLMYRYFMKNRTYRFVNVLQDLVNSYNNRPHRSLGGNAPTNVNQENVDEIRLESYLSGNVRISQLKYPFQRDYQQKWTEKFFKVSERYKRGQLPVYKLKDLADDPIEGTFYEPELQKVIKSEDVSYRVEKILKRRRRGKAKEVYL